MFIWIHLSSPGKINITTVKNILFNLYLQMLDVFSAKQLWNIPNFKMMLEFYFMFHRPKYETILRTQNSEVSRVLHGFFIFESGI